MPQSAADIKTEQTNLFLFVGAYDSGKSYAATSFGLRSKEYGGEDPRPAYVMELDGRLSALKGRPVQFDSYSNEEGAAGVLTRLRELREKCVRDRKSPFHTLIFDSFTSFCEMSIADSLEVTEKKLEGGGAGGRKRGDLTLLTIEDYGYEAEAVRKLLWEEIIDIKKYADVIITAHEVEKYKKVPTKPGEPTRTELDGYKILARNNIAAKIPTKFDEIYHFLPKDIVVARQAIRRQVVFQDGMARTSFPKLAASTAPYDISGIEFYKFWKEKTS